MIENLTPERVRLGVTPTLWWNDDFPSIDTGIPFGQCVSEMALAGFQGCSVGHKYPKDPAELKAALDLRNLRVSEPWTSTYFTISGMEQQTVDAFEDQLAFIKAMGGTDLVVAEFGGSSHVLPVALFDNRPVFDDRQWDQLANGLNQLGKIAADYGVEAIPFVVLLDAKGIVRAVHEGLTAREVFTAEIEAALSGKPINP